MINKFENYLRTIRGYSENTIRAYSNDLHTFAKWARENSMIARWSDIQRADIDKYLEFLYNEGLSPATTNRHLASLSGLFKYFQREGLLIINPCQYESRRKIAQTQPTTIPIDDIAKAYTKASGECKTMLGLLATTGIRIQEMLNLRWGDINFTDNTIRIVGKGNKERTVQTTKEVLSHIENIGKSANPSWTLFKCSQRQCRYMIYDALKPYSKATHLNPHSIRHTFATQLAKQGMNVATIAKTLGHKHIETSQKYIDFADIPTGTTAICLTQNTTT